MGRREKYAALTKEAVLDAAKQLFVTEGFDATSVDDIARLSEVSKGAVYHHFSDKREVFAELFRATLASAVQAVIDAASPTASAWESVESAVRAFLHSYATDADARGLLRQVTHVLGQDGTRAMYNEVALPLVRAMLVELDRIGELRPIAIDTTAQMLFGVVCDASTTVAMADQPDQVAHEVEDVMLYMLGGLRTQPGETE